MDYTTGSKEYKYGAIGVFDTATAMGLHIALPIGYVKKLLKRSEKSKLPIVLFYEELTIDQAQAIGNEMLKAAAELQAKLN